MEERNGKHVVEDEFLKAARNNGKVHTIFFVNGFQLRGRLVEFDAACIKVANADKGNKIQLIYKHAISTIEET